MSKARAKFAHVAAVLINDKFRITSVSVETVKTVGDISSTSRATVAVSSDKALNETELAEFVRSIEVGIPKHIT